MPADPPLAALVLPRAAVAQGDVAPWDWQLTALARARRPAVLWWWGVRRVRLGVAGAVCYLDGVTITTWASRWPITRTAADAVLVHRELHAHALPHTGNGSGVKSAPDDAPEGKVR